MLVGRCDVGRKDGDVDGDVGQELDGDVGQELDGDVGKELDGDVGQELDGDVGQELDGDVGQELDGDVGQELDGDVGQELDGDVGQELDGDVGQENLPPNNAEMAASVNSLGYELEEKDIQDWVNTDDLEYEHFSDQQIVEHVQQSHGS
ncbi:hypothetical protein EMCRGX_G025625 [Ephydatia muelleri]